MATSDNNIIIHWFRQDLRLDDNPSFSCAAQNGTVIPVFIFDDVNCGYELPGGASKWWLHGSLKSLNKTIGGKLYTFSGDPIKILLDLAERHDVKGVYWNRCYEPWQIERDRIIKIALGKCGVETRSFNGSLLWEPWDVLKKDRTPYKVFTPYFRKCCVGVPPPRVPLPAPKTLDIFDQIPDSLSVDELGLVSKIRWDKKLEPHWLIGEEAAQERLNQFIKTGLENYKLGRNFPAMPNVSRLSPHLHFGELSPNQAWYAVQSSGDTPDIDSFLSELVWREFSYYLLYHFPELPRKNFQPKFDAFPWLKEHKTLDIWKMGQTGYPIVDAGMRELWQTGYMHNRVRMIVGSFLVKNLLLHWFHGERWFWDCLVDADLANNSAGWQWIAGSGTDAAPYFRIFNPVTQGQRFDPNGTYTRAFVPELKRMPDKYLFNPWEAPRSVLLDAGLRLGESYPYPIVDLKASRLLALDAFKTLSKK